MATTTTYSFNLPVVGGSEDTWGTQLNTNWSALDDLLDGTTVIDGGPAIDTTFTIVDSTDNTKVVALDASSITTGTTRTVTIPDATGSMVLDSATQTLTDKTIDPSSNTIDGDVLDITFTPSNYTPDATPAEASDADDLAAHLQGIDTALGNAGGPNLVFIASSDASNDATLDFTAFDSGAYDAYLFVLQNVIPATDNVSLILRTSTDGGSNYDSGASDYAFKFIDSTTAEAADSSITLAGFTGSASGEDGVSLTVWALGPHLAKKTVFAINGNQFSSAGDLTPLAGSGARLSQADVDAVRFLFDSGNIESGTITMYGLKNSA